MPIDPVTLGGIIVVGIISFCDMVINLYTALKEGHLSIKCSDCCEMDMDDEEKPKSPH